MQQLTVNKNKAYIYNTAAPKNDAQKHHSGYARVINKSYYQPVPAMEWVEGAFHIAK